jgi:hypothetical protein
MSTTSRKRRRQIDQRRRRRADRKQVRKRILAPLVDLRRKIIRQRRENAKLANTRMLLHTTQGRRFGKTLVMLDIGSQPEFEFAGERFVMEYVHVDPDVPRGNIYFMDPGSPPEHWLHEPTGERFTIERRPARVVGIITDVEP